VWHELPFSLKFISLCLSRTFKIEDGSQNQAIEESFNNKEESFRERKWWEKLGEDLEGIVFLESISSHFSFGFIDSVFVG